MFRYPGGKAKLAKVIVQVLNQLAVDKGSEYREPFCGGLSIGLSFLAQNPHITRAWINDKDPGIADLWTSVIHYPELLQNLVRNFKPSVNYFNIYKNHLLNPPENSNPLLRGFMKLAIHQISYSGLGTKSGGPLGGQSQKSAYKIDCRWSPNYICKKIDKANQILAERTECTSVDFEQLICSNGKALIYLDPPYYVKGNDLYQEGFSIQDHERLAACLAKTKHKWLLSYDDCPEIRALYNWAHIESVDVNYSITATKDKETGERKSRAKPELLVSNA